MYGPGNPPRALKHRLTSSVMTAPLVVCAAVLTLVSAIDSGVPCISSRSRAMLVMSKEVCKCPVMIERNSSSFFLLPVIKVMGNRLAVYMGVV